MEKRLIKKLSQAGVDPAVILNLIIDEDEPESLLPSTPAQEEVSAQQPAEVVPAAQNITEAPPAQDKILEAIERLTGAIQASNIRSLSAGDPAQAETADSILASLIAPQKK